ncbi:AMP-binding protein [Lutibaculum baratangense]|uniref:Long-chain-fatty-acid--CoA ligase n=1 Tax=Lutibaculum baratangense AMV1 TaxID=631454 RepID=V4RIB0_9HYPH|nr:AMP-binding protein [Lutibaculum baratangense]ESR23010.1 Long-chain-fatty-acid--CoA ligase [Lutibaculum baratangense AMV1]
MIDIDRICPTTLPDALARTSALAPDLEAIVAPDGRMTFGAVAAEVARLRASLKALGVSRGDHVGICLGNSCRWVALFFAVASLGAVTVPISTRFRTAEMAYALKQSRVSFLFVADRFLKIDFVGMLREICPGVDTGLPDEALPDLREVVVVGDDVPSAGRGWDDFVAMGREPAEPTAAPDDVLLIQYTSGTTSFPKGVMLTHRNMLGNAFVSGGRMGFRLGDRFHSARPFFHVAGTTLSVLSALQHGVTLVTMSRFEPSEALRLIEEEACTHVSGNDTMALMLLNHPERTMRRFSLRGGWVAASPEVVRRVIRELGARECVVGYGLSEASPNIAQSCWWEPEEVRVAARMRPQPGLELEIRDTETGAPVAAGKRGEICVRGWSVMRGYFDKPDETKAALSDDGWLRTGDLGRLGDDGRLEFLGRVKDIIRVGGENVSPAEVEDILHRHPKVRLAQVVGVADPRLMEVPVAFVVANEGAVVDPAELIAWARENMAGFKVPRHVWVVEDFEAIGMTASSKVQKSKLAAHAASLLDGERAGALG